MYLTYTRFQLKVLKTLYLFYVLLHFVLALLTIITKLLKPSNKLLKKCLEDKDTWWIDLLKTFI